MWYVRAPLVTDNLDIVFEMHMIKSMQKICVYKRFTIHMHFLKDMATLLNGGKYLFICRKNSEAKWMQIIHFHGQFQPYGKISNVTLAEPFLCLPERKRAAPYAFVYIYPRRAVPYVHTYVTLRGLPYMAVSHGICWMGKRKQVW